MMKKLTIIALSLLVLAGCDKPPMSKYQGKGNMQAWVTERAKQDGFNVRWNMQADYDIPENYKTELNGVAIGPTIIALAKAMSYTNINRELNWPVTHTGQPYPYQNLIGLALCDKNTIVFTEISNPGLFLDAIKSGKYPGCTVFDNNLGVKPVVGIIPTTPLPQALTPPANLPKADGKNIITLDGKSAIPVIGDPDKEVPEMKDIKKTP